MGDHSYSNSCEDCGFDRGGLNDVPCACDAPDLYRKRDSLTSEVATLKARCEEAERKLQQYQVAAYAELRYDMASIVSDTPENRAKIERDALRAEVERMRPVYEAALWYGRATHTDDANCAAGDHDDCEFRVARKALETAIATASQKGRSDD